MNYTEDQLKAALVRALPDKLFLYAPFDIPCWIEKPCDRVNPHEWPAIVGMVEDSLTEEQQSTYSACVVAATLWSRANDTVWRIINAKWSARAQALADIGAIKVEETK